MPQAPRQHRPIHWKPAAHDQRRPNSNARGYDADWRRLRARFLRAHPVCCVEGCGEPATEVDHIKSVKERPDLRLDWNNLRSQCKPHHSSRTAREQGIAIPGRGLR